MRPAAGPDPSLSRRAVGQAGLRPGGLGNELLAYREYPNHPLFGEGPWHLTPDGTFRSSAASAGRRSSRVVADRSALARDRAVRGRRRTQELALWQGIDRLEFRTRIDGFAGRRRALPGPVRRDVEGATAGVRGRERGRRARPSASRTSTSPQPPFTLDYPAYDWFGLSTTARVALVGEGATPESPRAARATSVAEVIAHRRPGAGRGPSGPHGRARPVPA